MRSAVLLALCLVPAVTAFASVPPASSPHDDVTGRATAALGWPRSAADALQQAVRAPDYLESELDPKARKVTRIDATEHYRPDHHCDRIPPAADLDAFNATVVYIRSQRDLASATAATDPDGAMAALGRALHALQDCYSHSNIVDMGTGDAAAHQDAVTGRAPPVTALRLAGFLPGADDPEQPPGDDYAHGDINKDSPTGSPEASLVLPDGRTKYAAATALAQNATRSFLQEFDSTLTDGGRTALMAVQPQSDGAVERWPIPGAGVAALAMALAIVAFGRRRHV